MRVFFLLSHRMGVVRRQISKHAARLRRETTDAERALWFQLRSRRLLDHKFRSQWSLGPHVADFCCLAGRLVVEVDGSQHNEKVDAARTVWLKQHGFRVIRFWNNDVLTNMEGVLAVIAEALEASGQKKEEQQEQDPHPNPLPQAGEGEGGGKRPRPSGAGA